MPSDEKSQLTGKIAIATDDFISVTGHIGRCSGFIIYEMKEGKIASRVQTDNVFTNHRNGEQHNSNHEHGHAHSHAGLVEGLSGCSHLICSAAGWRVVEDLKQNNIEVVFTKESDADTVALNFAAGKLEMTDTGVCRAH